MSVIYNPEHFPAKKNVCFLGYCSISPLTAPAAERSAKFIRRQQEIGRGVIFEYSGDQQIARRFHRNFADLLRTSEDNVSMMTSTSEGLSMIANGYPFRPGDQIISYVHEYPANHYPWILQARHRGAELVLLDDVPCQQEPRAGCGPIPETMARCWSFDELVSRINTRTRVIALSHVQFTSGFAADLERLGNLCQEKKIDLVIDAAQSLGSLPLYPEQLGISCLAASGWKWLMGPIGSSVLYTSPEFRDKIEITMCGADQMVQDTEYLDHRWAPHTTGKKFEYSTVAYAVLDGLSVGVEQVFGPQTMEGIRERIFELQELALGQLDLSKYQPVVHPKKNRSGILSLIPRFSDARTISANLERENIIITPRDGYLRFAPHFCTDESEISRGVAALNRMG
jgi:cysteine desulfurase/selenocysteine lyase